MLMSVVRCDGTFNAVLSSEQHLLPALKHITAQPSTLHLKKLLQRHSTCVRIPAIAQILPA